MVSENHGMCRSNPSVSAAEAQCRPDHRGSVSTQTRPGTAFSMPPKRKGAPGAGAKPAAESASPP